MNIRSLRPLPEYFVLQDLTAITSSVFELKINPYQEEAYQAARAWFVKHDVYDPVKQDRFLSHGFEVYAGLSFSDADKSHLETCIAFVLWAFSFDDLSDEGELQSKPENLQAGVDISMAVLKYPQSQPPDYKYAKMLHDIWNRLRATASPDACQRFSRAVEGWMTSLIEQATKRASNALPSADDFIKLRRRTIGGHIAEAVIEYSLDLQIPEYVWEHPVLAELSNAAVDIMAWPNDLCSCNKEQSDGDYQNLVFCVMLEHDVDLQSAVDITTDMLTRRVDEYAKMKKQLPSFGQDVDRELAKYFEALEHYVQGTVVWYYESPRYFRGMDVSVKTDLIVPLFKPSSDRVSSSPDSQKSLDSHPCLRGPVTSGVSQNQVSSRPLGSSIIRFITWLFR